MKINGLIAMWDQFALWPHEYFSTLYNSYQHEFKSRILPDRSKIRAFWNAVSNHPLLDNHPVLDVPHWRERCIPISVHGDGVPVTGVGKSWSKSLDIISWASCLAAGTTMGTFNFIFAMFTNIFVKDGGRDTLKQFMVILAWSFECLYLGRHPDHNWNGDPWPRGSHRWNVRGKPLAGEDEDFLFCMPIIYRGDLDWKYKTLSLQNFNTADEPCNECRADSGVHNWKVFRQDAPSLATCWTTQTWLAAKQPVRCPLLALSFASILSVTQDFMHTMHLGIYQWMLASVLWVLVFNILPNDAAANMQTLMNDLNVFWRDNPSLGQGRFRLIRLSMFQGSDSSYPYLKGRAIELKRLVKPLKAIWEKCREKRRGHEHYIVHKQIGLMLTKFERLDDILDDHPPQLYPCLPEPLGAEFEKCCFDVLQVIQYIHQFYTTNFLLIPRKAVAKPLSISQLHVTV